MREVIRETWRSFSDNGGRLLGGAVAFYSLLSVAPILVVALRAAGAVVGKDATRITLFEHLTRWLGAGGAATVGDLLDRTDRATSLSDYVAVFVLLYASTRLFTQLKRSLNQIWGVNDTQERNLKEKLQWNLQQRVVALVFVLSVGFVLLALVFIKTALVVVSRWLPAPVFWHAVESFSSLFVATLLFVAIFKWLPDAKLSLRDAIIGAFVTALLFSAGAAGLSLFLGKKNVSAAYGPAGSIVMLLLWVQYSAQVFFLGAAFTAAHARLKGRGIGTRAEKAVTETPSNSPKTA